MDLLDVRQKFIALSGRRDLATTTVDDYDTDAGADFFINSGLRYLDRLGKNSKTLGRIFVEIAQGDWYSTFQYCRTIKEIWINSDETRYQLQKERIGDLHYYYNALISETDQGAPLSFSPAILRSMDAAADKDALGEFFNYVKTDDDGTYNGIIFLPAADQAYVLDIRGYFYTAEMFDNTDENYWSISNPDVLVWAALRSLEISYRNTEGAKDWERAIQGESIHLEFDLVDEETEDFQQMEG